MIKVKDLLRTKGREIWKVAPSTTVMEAIKLMSGTKIGALPVVTEGSLQGIISERDMMDAVAREGSCAFQESIAKYMTTEVVTVTIETSLEECMKIMTDKHIRHLPVVSEGNLVGILSIRDLVKTVITHKDSLISDLEKYIAGGR